MARQWAVGVVALSTLNMAGSRSLLGFMHVFKMESGFDRFSRRLVLSVRSRLLTYEEVGFEGKTGTESRA